MDKKTLLDAYTRLKTIREFEMRMRRENEAGQLPGFIHLYCGQEAIAVGRVAADLHAIDGGDPDSDSLTKAAYGAVRYPG